VPRGGNEKVEVRSTRDLRKEKKIKIIRKRRESREDVGR